MAHLSVWMATKFAQSEDAMSEPLTDDELTELRAMYDRGRWSAIRPAAGYADAMLSTHCELAYAAVNALPRLLAEIDRLRARQQELLATIVRVTNETPYPDEVRGWESQRAAMVAEIGTLRAQLRARELTADERCTLVFLRDECAFGPQQFRINAVLDKLIGGGGK